MWGIYGRKILVEMVYCSDPKMNHEDIAKTYIESNPLILEAYNNFYKKTGNHSYKDFLIYEYEGLGVSEKTRNSDPQIIVGNTNHRGINSIMSSYVKSGYECKQPAGPMF